MVGNSEAVPDSAVDSSVRLPSVWATGHSSLPRALASLSLARSVRKVTKHQRAFPNDASIMKVLYLAVHRIAQKWRACPTKCFGHHADTRLETGAQSLYYLVRWSGATMIQTPVTRKYLQTQP